MHRCSESSASDGTSASEDRLVDSEAKGELLEREDRAARRLAGEGATVRADPDRPRFHLAPPVGRLNDPNGLVFLEGVHHAFYQYSPLHPEKAVFWRHASSTDLLSWRDRGTVLSPSDWYDRNGCYSGCAVLHPEGHTEFFYTGNVKDAEGRRESYQCLAIGSADLESLEKASASPLLRGPAPGYTAHFRDPDVTADPATEGACYRMLLGAQREDLRGAVVRYDSADLREWRFRGELSFDDPALEAGLGYMYECPVLLRMADEVTGEDCDVLLFCPQGMEPEGERFRNVCQSGYVVGHLEGTCFTRATPFQELDLGFEFYAPQAFTGEVGRTVLLGWMGNPGEDDQPSATHSWVHLMTLPRELALRAGKLQQRPAHEVEDRMPLTSARQDGDRILLPLPGRETEGNAAPLAELGRHHRLSWRATLPDGDAAVRLEIAGSEGGVIVLVLDCQSIAVDRGGALYQSGGTIRRADLQQESEHQLEMFFDGSALEIFVDGGSVVMTLRAYLSGEVGTSLQAVGSAQVREVRAARWA